MANQNHQTLACFIKDVHSKLRKTSSELGADMAWLEHCKNHDILAKYAEYMQALATTHWENNSASEASEAYSRIQWTVNFCDYYFSNKEYECFKEKEIIIASKIGIDLEIKESFSEPLQLIDVGSCYNPFLKYHKYNVLALDLCPANNSVLQCDFLSVPVGSQNLVDNTKVMQLKEQYYDVVTFCFLLEYIPSSNQRISACEKAYSLLRPGGLLIINTPDSKHVGANSRLMKCWRYTLAQLGFNRIKYEKCKHMHCMAFRKSLHKEIAVRWAKLHKEPYMEFAIHIPQDFQTYDKETEVQDQHASSDLDFSDMPFCDVDNML